VRLRTDDVEAGTLVSVVTPVSLLLRVHRKRTGTGTQEVRGVVTLHPKLATCHIGASDGLVTSGPTSQHAAYD
jgi:hypothetical protein